VATIFVEARFTTEITEAETENGKRKAEVEVEELKG
jgi:hypothetical protein